MLTLPGTQCALEDKTWRRRREYCLAEARQLHALDARQQVCRQRTSQQQQGFAQLAAPSGMAVYLYACRRSKLWSVQVCSCTLLALLKLMAMHSRGHRCLGAGAPVHGQASAVWCREHAWGTGQAGPLGCCTA